jgi:NADH dehydrogenase
VQRILILGGTGFVGRALCERMAERHAETCVRVPTRHISHGRGLMALPQVEIEQGNVFDEGQLAHWLRGCDAVVNLVGIRHGSEARLRRVHAELPRKLAAACTQAGLRRIVHVSALGAAADAPSHYLRSKAAGEAALLASGLDVTILRPSVIFGEDDRFLNLFAQLQRWTPVLPLPSAQTRFQPVWVHDVALALVRCLEDGTTAGRTFEAAGPTVYTLAELVQLAGRCSGHERLVIGLPEGIGRLQATLMQLLPGEPLLSTDNLDSMKVDNVATGMLPGLDTLGIRPASPANVVQEYLRPAYDCARLDALRARRGW